MRDWALSSMALGALLASSGCSLLFETASADARDAGPGGDDGATGVDAGPQQATPRLWAGPNASHTCLSRGPKLLCWGVNHSGQLGNGNRNSLGDEQAADALAVVTEFPSNILSVALAENHTCATTAAAKLYCWGSAANGVLGYGDTNDNPNMISEAGAVRIGGAARWVGVTLDSTCVVRERDVVCFGKTDSDILCGLHSGECPTEDLGDNEFPETIANAPVTDNVTELAVGTSHACAVLENGQLDCWGLNLFGELGSAATPGDAATFKGPQENSNGLHSLALGSGFGCALDNQNEVRCWGNASTGQLGVGNGENVDALAAALALEFSYQVDKVVAGEAHACVLSVNRETVQCWGQGVSGALGRGAPQSIGRNEKVVNTAPLDIPGVVDIAAGRNHTCAAIDTGEFETTEVVCWGLNLGILKGDSGVLGLGVACEALGANGKCIWGDEPSETIDVATHLRFNI